jgi:hypothetical protein
MEQGRFILAADYLKAERLRALLAKEMRAAFESVDVLVTPTLPLVAWKKLDPVVRIQGQEEHALHACWRYTFPFNLVGLPAITVPCGFANELPGGFRSSGDHLPRQWFFELLKLTKTAPHGTRNVPSSANGRRLMGNGLSSYRTSRHSKRWPHRGPAR